MWLANAKKEAFNAMIRHKGTWRSEGIDNTFLIILLAVWMSIQCYGDFVQASVFFSF